MNLDSIFEANKLLWNEKADKHFNSDFYKNDQFLKGLNSLNKLELDLLGNIAGKKILHLQCHFGQDTLSMSRMGAKTFGLDFSENAIALAQKMNEDLKLYATFVCANVYDALEIIKERSFDIVFASYGAIIWLNDLQKWANICAEFLKENGELILAEFHPTLYLLNFESGKIEYPYFNSGYIEELVQKSYTGEDLERVKAEYFCQHSLDEIFSSILQAGLNIQKFKELDYSYYNCFSNMKQLEKDKYVFQFLNHSFPYIFGLKAIKK